MQQKIIEKTVYGTPFKVTQNNIKINKDFQISLIEDRVFKYICKVYPKVIIKYLAHLCRFNNNLIETAYFMDTTMPDLRFNDKKIDVLIYLLISNKMNILI